MLSLLVLAVYHVTRIDSLQIKHVSVQGGETIPHSLMQEKVWETLSGNYLHLVPKRFIPTYPEEAVLKNIRAFDRVQSAEVRLTDDQTLAVSFTEYEPYALWCASLTSEPCFFIDASGYAFAQAPRLQGSAFVRYIDEGAVPGSDTQAFDSAFVDLSKTFLTLLEDRFGFRASHVHKIGTYDLEITLVPDGVLKVSQSLPAQESFDNLEALLRSDEFKHLHPGAFQYIDLRFGDKVFVKEETAASSTESGD